MQSRRGASDATRRARPRGADAAAPASGIALELPFAPPFDWPAMLAFLAPRAIPGVERIERGRYRRTVALGEARGTLEVALDERGDRLRARLPSGAAAAGPLVVRRLRALFDLDADPAAIAAHLCADPRLRPLVGARPGLRVPGAWEPFELAVRAILGQQVTVAAATQLAGRLVAAWGEPLAPAAGEAPDGLRFAFPAPERLAGADLAALGMPRARAAAISSLAAALVSDGSLFDAPCGLAEAVARLRALPGVGEWTAHYVAMRALRQPDAFPAADVGLLRAMAGPTGRPTPAELLARAERWRPWRAYAAMHLWTAAATAGTRGAVG